MTAYSLIVAMCYGYIAIRLFVYQRHGARYRWEMGLIAYILFVISARQVIEIMIYRAPVFIYDVPLAVLVAFLIFRARGNVARLIARDV